MPTLPLILAASKYFRYNFQLCLPFYPCPNIPDIFLSKKWKIPFSKFPLQLPHSALSIEAGLLDLSWWWKTILIFWLSTPDVSSGAVQSTDLEHRVRPWLVGLATLQTFVIACLSHFPEAGQIHEWHWAQKVFANFKFTWYGCNMMSKHYYRVMRKDSTNSCCHILPSFLHLKSLNHVTSCCKFLLTSPRHVVDF